MRAVDIRIAEGAWSKGPLTAWMRPRVGLVEGEPSSPLERAMIVVDATNGLAPALSTEAFAFINPDLTVHLHRPLAGEWLCIAGRSIPEPLGTGLVQGALFDPGGEVGRCLQSLVVRAR